jgi:integrase/recombinase XerD
MANFIQNQENYNCFTDCYTENMIVKLTAKVHIRTDFIKKDGTSAIFIQILLNRKKIVIPLHFCVSLKDFDTLKQRVKKSNPRYVDYNLLIEKKLADINAIEINYKLSNRFLTLQSLLDEINNPTAKVDFLVFWETEMNRQKELLKTGTYRQQMSVLNKLKSFRKNIFFYEINEDLIQDLKAHCKNKLNNTDTTISTTIKSFKKYLHIANKKGIRTPITFDEIKNKQFKGNRTFLTSGEVKRIYKYWDSEFICDTHKRILSRFLFSCFTGLRVSDVQQLKKENFFEDAVVFTAEKTGKFHRIPLNETAKKFVCMENIFFENYTGEYMNRELKQIAIFLGIQKNVSYHVSRHTFATLFYESTKDVIQLQKILGHTKITDTMIYVHIVENFTNTQILTMDSIIL